MDTLTIQTKLAPVWDQISTEYITHVNEMYLSRSFAKVPYKRLIMTSLATFLLKKYYSILVENYADAETTNNLLEDTEINMEEYCDEIKESFDTKIKYETVELLAEAFKNQKLGAKKIRMSKLMKQVHL